MSIGEIESAGELHRRGFLHAGAAATAATLASTARGWADDTPEKPSKQIPRRTLGKTGVDVTILNLGTWLNPGLNRLIQLAYANGVRYIDTAKSYRSEPTIGQWLETHPEVRKEIFLVTKDHPNTPRELIKQLDLRLADLKTDYVDLFFIHGIGRDYPESSIDWPKSREFKETIEAIKKSGKARFVGFSCHDARKAEYLQAAADGGFVDAIMVAYTPWLENDHPVNRALDACHKKGIGLISMKQVAGGSNILSEVPKHVPELKERGLSPYQALLHAIWTDERIASSCVSMRNTDQIRENCQAAKSFAPLKQAELERLRGAWLAAGPTFCANCDGSCARAAGTEAALCDLTRILTYHDHHGNRSEARRQYEALSQTDRNWEGADLEAARQACPSKLDFATLLPRVDEYFA
jgi:predicted aldo/keto reductase-like oxidoreductase